MTEIILVRHGETAWNASEKFRGQADVALNENGRKQARALGAYLEKEQIDFIYSSPLKRAVETVGVIARHHGLKVNTVGNLIDINFGDWQGLSLQEVEARYPELYRDRRDTPEQVRVPGGESLEDVRNRAFPFIEDAIMRCGEGGIVFVSHRVVNKVLFCALLGMELSRFWNLRIDLGGLTRFACGNGGLVLIRHNDTSFLGPAGVPEVIDF